MLRSILNSSDIVSRTIQEELDFVQNYLEIQKSRFKNLLDYSITVESGINYEIIIPKSSIQTYVENAVKHGLSLKPDGGKVSIHISQSSGYLNISITDNGIGRKHASEMPSSSTGKGNSIMRQYYQLLNRSNKNPIREEFIDMYDEKGNAIGTQVLIGIPDNFNFPGTTNQVNT